MRVFLSYAAQDSAAAHEVAKSLRTSGYDVYPSASWPKQVESALRRADVFVAILSPDSVDSPYASREVELGLQSEHLAGKLIPVFLRRTTRMPWILETFQPIHVESGIKPAVEQLTARLRSLAGNDRA